MKASSCRYLLQLYYTLLVEVSIRQPLSLVLSRSNVILSDSEGSETQSKHALSAANGRLATELQSGQMMLVRWNLGEDVGSVPRSALDLQPAPQVADSLLHRAQPQMTRK